MPSKKKKFNARFPPARIKKIMQTDEDVGKVAAAVPVIISKALEMFVQSLVERASEYTRARNAKTMTTSHLKRCITSENQFDFLKDLVENVPDLPLNEEEKDGEPKPKRKRAQRNPPAQNKEKKKTEKKKPQAAAVSDESDEEPESEEEDSSSEGPSNPSSVGNTHANCSNSALAPPLPVVPSITVTKPESEQTEEPTSSSSTAPLAIPRLAQVSGVMGNSLDNEDDDYDS